MSNTTEIQSTTMQNQFLESTISQATFATQVDEIQTRSKTKMSRMKGNLVSFGKKKTEIHDRGSDTMLSEEEDDESTQLCKLEEEHQQQQQQQKPENNIPLQTIGTKNSISTLRKRQQSVFYHQKQETYLSNDNIQESQTTNTTTKRRKLHSRGISTTIETDSNNDDSRSPSALTMDGSPLEIETRTSPMSPMPASIINDEAITFTSTLDNKKENAQGYVEGKQGTFYSSKNGLQQLSFVPDDENRSTGNVHEINLNATKSTKDDDSGDEFQQDQRNFLKELMATQHSTESMECDTQSTCVTESTNGIHGSQDSIKNGHMKPTGFFKRVASYIFG